MLARRDLALESIGKALRMEFCEGKRELLISGLWQPHVLDDRHPRDHAGDLDPTAFEDRTCVGALDQAVGNPAKSPRPPPSPRLVDEQQLVDLFERQLSDIHGCSSSSRG